MEIKLLSVCAFLFVTVPFSANAVMEASWDDEGVELAEKPEHCPMNIYIKNADGKIEEHEWSHARVHSANKEQKLECVYN